MMICIGCCPTASIVYDYIVMYYQIFYMFMSHHKVDGRVKNKINKDNLPDHITQRNESAFTIQDV